MQHCCERRLSDRHLLIGLVSAAERGHGLRPNGIQCAPLMVKESMTAQCVTRLCGMPASSLLMLMPLTTGVLRVAQVMCQQPPQFCALTSSSIVQQLPSLSACTAVQPLP